MKKCWFVGIVGRIAILLLSGLALASAATEFSARKKPAGFSRQRFRSILSSGYLKMFPANV